MVLLVMLAGSVVRMTGSGMGCPDWPKCFGYLIPPTDIDQLTWKPTMEYFRGQMIIYEGELLVAKNEFISATAFSPDHWKQYEKHDYVIFNAFHTWTEYINRLLGALSGLPVLALFVLGLVNMRRDWITFFLSGLTLVALGFVAWLGKLVVDGNLIPNSITYHMFGALALVFLLIGIIFRNRQESAAFMVENQKIRLLGALIVAMTLVQIFMGTNVREQVDEVGKLFVRNEWIEQLGALFYIHRSFSIMIVLLNVWWIRMLIRNGVSRRLPMFLLVLIAIEIAAGVLFNYAGFPAWAQPIHLLSAALIVAIQFYLALLVWVRPKISVRTG